MKPGLLAAVAAASFACALSAAQAQMGTPPPSGPPAARPLPRHPERPPLPPGSPVAMEPAPATPGPALVPQVNVPIGPKPDAALPPAAPASEPRPSANSARARCEALGKASAQRECRRRADLGARSPR